MSEKLAKYIVTTGKFDNECNNIREARKELKKHVMRMKALYPLEKHTYGIYVLIEEKR